MYESQKEKERVRKERWVGKGEEAERERVRRGQEGKGGKRRGGDLEGSKW